MGNMADMLKNAAGGAINGGLGAIMGLATQGIQNKMQLKQQQKLQDQQIAGQQKMQNFTMGQQLQMWKDTSYGAQKEQMQKAGINPALMYGMGGGGGQSTGSPQTSVQGATASGEQGGMQGMAIMLQQRLTQAQIANLEADAANKIADAEKKKGVDTELGKSQTANNILQGVILEYTGKDLKEEYENVKKPYRGVQQQTYEYEQEARQAVAHTINTLWQSGDLLKKSNAEIEAIVLKNAKTAEETKNIKETFKLIEQNVKGAELSNIIKELEAKLQTATGIDSNSAGWLKILGRLFVQLTGG